MNLSSHPATYGSANYALAWTCDLKAATDESIAYSIDTILLGNGVRNVGKNLLTSRWNASSKEVCNQQTYFEIDISSFSFEVVHNDERSRYQTINLSCHDKDLPSEFFCFSQSF